MNIYMFIHYVTFFFHLSVNKHLGCLHIFSVVNNSAMNIGMHISFEISGVFLFFR